MKYLNFPIALLRIDPLDIRGRMDAVMDYCLYERSLQFKGTEKEKIELARKDLGIKYGNLRNSYQRGAMLYDAIFPNSPKTSVTKDMIFDFYKNSKSEFEIACFLAFAAVKSILQRQPYTKITNEYLIGRMAGNSKAGEEINDFVFKYSNRYQLDRIKNELRLNWGLKLYSGKMRGYYVSFGLPLEQLIMHAELKRKKYREAKLKEQTNEVRQRVLNSIYNKQITAN